MHISIAIGRDVGDTPMSDKQWNKYKGDLQEIVLVTGQGTVELVETGEAFYSDASETFYRIWAEVDDNTILDIRRALRPLTVENGQWGIAFSFVATEMIQP
jgi:hypothetical protein